MTFNIASLIRESAKKYPDKPALLFDGGSLTFREVEVLSDRLAAGLQLRGLEPGDRVAIQLPNIPQFVISYFGILKAGCVVVPMNPLLTEREIGFELSDSGAKMLITWADTVAAASAAADTAGVKALVVVDRPGAPPAEVGEPFDTLLSTLAPGERPPLRQGDPGDTAVIVYTSGTSGRPKGAQLTHFQLLMSAETPGRLFGVRDDDVVLVALPLFHVFGMSCCLNVAMRFGATISLMPRFEPAKALETIRRHRITVFEGVPTMYIALLRQADVTPGEVATLRVGVCGGASLPAEVMDAFEARFGVVILEGYGLTETASTTTFNISADQRRMYSVGKPIWGVDVEVWGEQDQPLGAGKANVGEVLVRGVNVMKGYHNDPEATAAAFTRGWMRTGDLGYFDEDGYLFIVDRKKDLVIRGGYNVYPREIEEVLYGYRGVAEVAVVGVPDVRLGEEVKAFVVALPGVTLVPEELIAFAKERLAAYKYPRSIEVRDAFVHGPTGKVLKTELR